jgi:hypothetical protein
LPRYTARQCRRVLLSKECHAERYLSASVTAGLRCPPEIGPNVRMSATNAEPVAMVFASRVAIAWHMFPRRFYPRNEANKQLILQPEME